MSTVNAREVEKFSAIAAEWWDAGGKFKPLHLMNPVRIKYIRDKAVARFKLDEDKVKVLDGIDIVDIGCGGGLLSEPLGRLGANVTGLDASFENIEIAKAHIAASGVSVNYQNQTIEALAATGAKFDIVLAMEVIEHVNNTALFLENCVRVLKPGGMLIISTINRTAKGFLFAIIGAEYVLRMLPRGTHEWKKFIKPSEINAQLQGQGVSLKEMAGVHFNPITGAFKLTDDVSVNYMMYYENE